MSKVYFTDMRALPGTNLLKKLKKLIHAAGIGSIDFENKFTAIKIHFGEPGNLAFLRPNFAKAVVEEIKALGGRPFLTDCSTLYVGKRKNALDHLDAAMENGFSPYSCGCHIIIGDGLNGANEVKIPVKNGVLVNEAKIGATIAEADVIVSLNHFKGHEGAGFGGAIKNLGMGCASRAGKMEQHNCGKPVVNEKKCIGCGVCFNQCAHSAFSFDGNKKAVIDHGKCVGCGRCIATCRKEAIRTVEESALDDFCMKMAEYAQAVVQDKPNFHINIVMDVSPYCDCHGENDTPIIPDVGMFASFDPVALDMACADACNKMPAIQGSRITDNEEKGHVHGDRFSAANPNTNWRVTLAHSEKIGIGTTEYELITVK